MKIVEKALLFASIVIMALPVKAQYCSQCVAYDNYWGEWNSFSSNIMFWGNYSDFIIYDARNHKSEYFFKLKINNYIIPSKKIIKQHIKSGQWFNYDGYVEYWVHEDYPTIKDVFKKFGGPKRHNFEGTGIYNKDKKPIVKRVAQAKIQILCRKWGKNVQRTYNIFFDDVGYGLTIYGGYTYFNE